MPPEKIAVNDVAQELKQTYGINKNISNSLTPRQKKKRSYCLY